MPAGDAAVPTAPVKLHVPLSWGCVLGADLGLLSAKPRGADVSEIAPLARCSEN